MYKLMYHSEIKPRTAGRLRVLIGMATSDVERAAFESVGCDAWSCDLLPSETGSPKHILGDVFDIIEHGWDLAVFHPTCTYLTGAAEWASADPDFARWPGVGYHQRVKPGTLTGIARREARALALDDVRRLMAAPISRIAIENPVGAISAAIRKPDQVVQPHWFGDDASKATCWWLKGLPPLAATRHVAPRMVNGRPRWGNQTDSGQNRLSPGVDRWKERSRTYPGMAMAMAAQWGSGGEFATPKLSPNWLSAI